MNNNIREISITQNSLHDAPRVRLMMADGRRLQYSEASTTLRAQDEVARLREARSMHMAAVLEIERLRTAILTHCEDVSNLDLAAGANERLWEVLGDE